MVERMWRMFTSMRLGIILLLLFGGISIIGTVIPQESLNPVQAAGLNPMWQAGDLRIFTPARFTATAMNSSSRSPGVDSNRLFARGCDII